MPIVAIKLYENVLIWNVKIKLMIDAINAMLVNDVVTMYLNHLCFE